MIPNDQKIIFKNFVWTLLPKWVKREVMEHGLIGGVATAQHFVHCFRFNGKGHCAKCDPYQYLTTPIRRSCSWAHLVWKQSAPFGAWLSLFDIASPKAQVKWIEMDNDVKTGAERKFVLFEDRSLSIMLTEDTSVAKKFTIYKDAWNYLDDCSLKQLKPADTIEWDLVEKTEYATEIFTRRVEEGRRKQALAAARTSKKHTAGLLYA